MSNYEKNLALRQGHGIASEDGYFEARPQIDSMDRRKVFGAGFERGWEAALAAEPAQERIQALELEVRQLTEQIAGLRHAPTPQADSQPAPVLVYPPLPEPFIGVQNQPWVGHAEVIRSAIGEDGVIPCFTAGQMVAYADATHAARAPADSVLEDAAREAIEKVLALFPFNALIQKFSVNNGPCLTADNDDEFYSVKRVLAFLTEIKTTLDAARKQGANHD